jgi:ribosome biogenesis protein BRX1
MQRESEREMRKKSGNSGAFYSTTPTHSTVPQMAPSAVMKDLKRKRGTEEDAADAGEKTPLYKQRVLTISSRGISQRQRHLMADLISLLPHSKKGELFTLPFCALDLNVSLTELHSLSLDAKLEDKHSLPSLNEIAYLSSCNNILFFEARRQHGDLYLWAAKAPNGPSCRFHVLNAHTMDEMKMTGNCLKGSRPIVVFDQQFDESPHMKLIKEVLTHVSSLFAPLTNYRCADSISIRADLRCT